MDWLKLDLYAGVHAKVHHKKPERWGREYQTLTKVGVRLLYRYQIFARAGRRRILRENGKAGVTEFGDIPRPDG